MLRHSFVVEGSFYAAAAVGEERAGGDDVVEKLWFDPRLASPVINDAAGSVDKVARKRHVAFGEHLAVAAQAGGVDVGIFACDDHASLHKIVS